MTIVVLVETRWDRLTQRRIDRSGFPASAQTDWVIPDSNTELFGS
jgi:hypothetical protein